MHEHMASYGTTQLWQTPRQSHSMHYCIVVDIQVCAFADCAIISHQSWFSFPTAPHVLLWYEDKVFFSYINLMYLTLIWFIHILLPHLGWRLVCCAKCWFRTFIHSPHCIKGPIIIVLIWTWPLHLWLPAKRCVWGRIFHTDAVNRSMSSPDPSLTLHRSFKVTS